MRSFNRKANITILTLYLFLIVYSFVFVFVTDNTVLLWILIPVLAAGLWFAAKTLLSQVSKIYIKDHDRPSWKNCAAYFAVISFFAFLVLMVWFIAYRPGSFQGDCMRQFRQVFEKSYDDWHPVLQTLLFYTLPLKLTHNAFWAPTFFQMVWFSLTIGYLGMVIYKYAGRMWSAVTILYIMLNPYTGQMLLYPWKDCAFAITGTLAMIMSAEIYFSEGKWADKWYRCVLLGLALSCTSIFRHNAILYTAVLLIAIFFVLWGSSGKTVGKLSVGWLAVTGTFILSWFLIKVPLYNALDVTRTPQSVVQAVGLPMSIIGNVVKETPGLLDEETAEFAYSIADQEAWENDYELGNFGVMKYYGEVDLDPIEKKGTVAIVKMAFRCIGNSPKASLKAIFALTDIVYGLDLKDEGYIGAQIIDNDYGIMYRGNERLADLLMTYYKLVRLHGLNYFRQFAFALLALLTVILAKCDLTNRHDWKKILLCLGIFTYSFGTMILLTSADSRFFYIDYPVCPLAMIIILRRNNDTIGEKT